jgi:signal transduction histidine kinase
MAESLEERPGLAGARRASGPWGPVRSPHLGQWLSTRFWIFALAIVAPAVVVAILGYVSLRQWERSAELLFREQARDVAAMAADKIEMVLRQSDDELLARLATIVERGDVRPETLDAFARATPLVQRLYLFDRGGALLYPSAPGDGDAAVFAALLGEVSRGLWERGGRRDVVAGDRSLLATVLRDRGGAPVLAVVARDPTALQREVLDRTIKALDSPIVCVIVDEAGHPVSDAGAVAGASLLVTVPFRQALPTWRVALYQPPGASPRQSVRRQVMLFTTAFGVLLVVICAGLVVTYRLVRRETEMARLKSDFVANVSHDLKTPLSVIRMFGETLEMDRVRDEASRREYYRVITRESERLSRLIDNVLDFSRIEGGRRRYERVPTAVEPLVRDVLEAFAYPLTRGGFKVEVQVAPELPEVPLDAEAVAQALANLVDNAIKYSADRKTLRVEAAIADGELALSVVDEGIGIARDEHRRIFEKFYRVGRSETQGRRGSGVGLALVRHVAEAHGGRVIVESSPGEGSRFTIRIPVTKENR